MFSRLLGVVGVGVAVAVAAGVWRVEAQVEPRGPMLVTFGPDAPTAEGDPDHVQVLYVQVPATTTGRLFVRLFDPDTGGAHDQSRVAGRTTTRFTLLGGAGAFTAAARGPSPAPDEMTAGVRLASETYGQSPDIDDRWVALASVEPSQGETVDGFSTFKLVVQGAAGSGGNAFDVDVSLREGRAEPPPGLRMFTYAVTMRLPTPETVAEMRFEPEGTDRVRVYNFDAAGGRIAVETSFRTLPVTASGQDEWRDSTVELAADEVSQTAALSFGGGTETPNDGTFYALARNGRALPIQLPIRGGRANRRPVPVWTAVPLANCTAVDFDASRSTDPDGHRLTFAWAFGDGATGTGAALVHTYAGPGTYDPVLQVRDSSGRVASGSRVRIPVTLNRAPTARAGADVVASPGKAVAFDGSGSSDADGAIRQYVWAFGDGQTGSGPTPTHTFARPGRYRVRLTVADGTPAPCNVGTDDVDVWVNAAPVAVPGVGRTAAPGQSLTLDGSRSIDPDGSIVAYTWDLGDGSTATDPKVVHAYSRPGTYRVGLSVRDDANADNSVATSTVAIVVNQAPMASIAAVERAAIAEVVSFDASASSDSDGRILDYTWNFGDGATAKGEKAAYAFRKPGRFEVTLRVRDNSGAQNETDEASVVVVVNAPPVAEAGDDQRVSASEVRFDGSRSQDPDGRIREYRWDFGDGSSSADVSPVHVYRAPGVYRVRLAVTDDSGTVRSTADDAMTVVINEAPLADAGADQIGAPGQPLTFASKRSFDRDGEITEYRWDFGDGHSAIGPSVTHAFERPGTYTVELTVRDETGHERASDHDEVSVIINAPPVANAGADRLAAPGEPVVLDGALSFDPDGAIKVFEWTFSDGAAPVRGARATRTFDRPGVYAAQLTVTDNSNASNATVQDAVTIRINQAPAAVPGRDVTTWATTVTFDASASTDPDGDPLTYTWDFGDGSPPASGRSVVHTYAAGGSYPVALTVADGTGLSNSRATASMTVRINRAPVARAGDDRTVCAGGPVLFDGTASTDPDGGVLRYRWDFGDGTTASGVNPTKTYNVGGVYPVTLTVEDDSGLPGNTSTDQTIVRVAESPIADAGPDIRVCANAEVKFDGTASRDLDGVVNQYTWDFGDGSQGGGATPFHRYTKPGTYRVFLTVEGDPVGTCSYTHVDEKVVTVVSSPVARFSAPEAVGLNRAVRFDASASAGAAGQALASWRWDFGDGTTGEGQAVSHAYAKPGRYFVTLTTGTGEAGLDCASGYARRAITVNAGPTAAIKAPQLVGVNQEVVLDASGSADSDGAIASFDWDFGDGATSSGVAVRHRYGSPGRYTVTLTARDDAGVENSAATASTHVVVNAAPRPIVTSPRGVCVGEPARLSAVTSTDADGAIKSYRWSFGDGASGDGIDVAHAYAAAGRYSVTLAVDDGTAVDNSRAEATVILPVNEPPTPQAGPNRRVCAADVVAFDGSRSADRDGTITSYRWDFGDGATSTGPTVTHRYGAPGRHIATLTVVDDSGTSCGTVPDAADVVVNARPVASAGPDQRAHLGGAYDAVRFDATASSDADGDPLTYRWDFGDGTTGAGARTSHVYTRPGRYVVRLTVRDGSGLPCGEAQDELVVDVRARP